MAGGIKGAIPKLNLVKGRSINCVMRVPTIQSTVMQDYRIHYCVVSVLKGIKSICHPELFSVQYLHLSGATQDAYDAGRTHHQTPVRRLTNPNGGDTCIYDEQLYQKALQHICFLASKQEKTSGNVKNKCGVNIFYFGMLSPHEPSTQKMRAHLSVWLHVLKASGTPICFLSEFIY